MSYVDPNFKSKREFIEAVKRGDKLRVYNPSGFPVNQNGVDCIEGPHYPQPHRWYASVVVVDGIVTKVK